MTELEISESAKFDIKETLAYIKDNLQNPKAASSLADLISEEFAILKKHPFSGTPVQDKFLANYGFRFLMIKNFKAYYLVRKETEKTTICIIRFLYAKRDYETILNNETE